MARSGQSRLIGHLEPTVPGALYYLVDDWFREITLYDNRLKSAQYRALDDGTFEVTLEIESAKVKSDGLGSERSVAVNDRIDVGFFLDREEAKLYEERRIEFDWGRSTVTVKLDELPAKAAIDPRHLLIDRLYTDNIRRVTAS